MYWQQIAEYESHRVTMEDEVDITEPVSNAAEINAAREWLDIDDDDCLQSSKDILGIVKTCLKTVKKLKTGRTIKMMTQLVAIAEYVKLRAHYQTQPKCSKPCLSASIAIARRMGKGGYFACQIRRNERYLLQHQQLPPSKAGAYHGQYTLLDNENVLHAVRRYLAAQNLGTITPHQLCRNVNDVILPALDMTGHNSYISERTAINWLKKLGYVCKDVRKGIYHDGHERPDVVEARQKFLAQMKDYER
jgi:hypothetical protein